MLPCPAPVAPAHGTAASTRATERFEWRRKWRAMVSPIIPAPTTTTSNVSELESGTRNDPVAPAGMGRLCVGLLPMQIEAEDEKGRFGSLQLLRTVPILALTAEECGEKRGGTTPLRLRILAHLLGLHVKQSRQVPSKLNTFTTTQVKLT